MNISLPTDTWNHIIDQIGGPDPDTRTVYVIWLMQASKGCERIARGYFAKLNILPVEVITRHPRGAGPTLAYFDESMAERREFRYTVGVKSKCNRIHTSAMLYRIVHNRKVVSLTFLFNEHRDCYQAQYSRSNRDYNIYLRGTNPTVAYTSELPGQPTCGIYFTDGIANAVYKTMHDTYPTEESCLSVECAEARKLLRKVNKVIVLAVAMIAQAKKDVYE